MNLLTPPTDSLYKFMAIAGLILCVFGISFPYSTLNAQLTKASQLSVKDKVNRVEVDSLNRELNLDLKLLQIAQSHSKAKTSTVATSKEEEERSRKITALQKTIDDTYRSIIQDDAEWDNLKEDMRLSRADEKILADLAGFGFVLALGSFFLWYWHIQKHQDVVAKMDVEQHATDLSMKKVELALKQIELEEKQKAQATLTPEEASEATEEVAGEVAGVKETPTLAPSSTLT